MIKVVNLFKQIFGSKHSHQPKGRHQPVIIPRTSHHISRKNISSSALKVLYRLHKAGYSAYLVGGSVRDLLLGHRPKDFDVVTDAHPEEIQQLFRNSYIIGRRFRLVHVRFGSEIIEVATFRGSRQGGGRIQTEEGLLLRDNVYGTLEDDVWRRDFTVNALYYNIADFSVVDYTGGMQDLERRRIHMIGDPTARYHEDPVRMLRALRLAAKLDFEVEEQTAKPIKKHQELLAQISPARLLDKMLKIFHSGKSVAAFKLLQEFNVFPILFPEVAEAIKEPGFQEFLIAAFNNTDERIYDGKTINSAFLFAVLLWCPIQIKAQRSVEHENYKEYQAQNAAMSEVLHKQLKIIAIPRRFTTVMREIWNLQYFLEHARARRVYKVLHHPRFRAAYDFLGLRSETYSPQLKELFDWWTVFQQAGDDKEREELISSRFKKSKRRRKRKKKASNGEGIHSSGE